MQNEAEKTHRKLYIQGVFILLKIFQNYIGSNIERKCSLNFSGHDKILTICLRSMQFPSQNWLFTNFLCSMYCDLSYILTLYNVVRLRSQNTVSHIYIAILQVTYSRDENNKINIEIGENEWKEKTDISDTAKTVYVGSCG